jgi:23S rRNA (pseudouridine1915-N3)-methyltransferase
VREVTLITVGKLKDAHLEALEADYFKRLTSPKLRIVELKANDLGRDAEGKQILEKVAELSKGNSPYMILLSEWGKTYGSADFSRWWYGVQETHQGPIFLVIGGDEGHGEDIQKQARAKLSLSPMTYPHKLARLILIEQLYRAQCIQAGHPYHK